VESSRVKPDSTPGPSPEGNAAHENTTEEHSAEENVVEESPVAASPSKPSRLLALDALRGFSMFWLLGGTQLVRALAAGAPEGSFLAALGRQFTHVEWEGFHFYDFIFPLFLFCIGVAVPLSVARRLESGDSKARILRHSIVRFALMVFFGWWVNGNLLGWDLSTMALSYSVLMMLGFGYLIAVVLVLHTSLRTQILATAGILLGYWAVQMAIPFPGRTAGQFLPGGIFSDWLYDHSIGQLEAPWKSRHGRGWPVTLWNHGATAMLGVFAYAVLKRSPNPGQAVLRLLAGGLALLLLGWLWSLWLPIVKNRWSSTYVLWCGGLSWMLFALFHWLVEIRGWRRWSGLFVVIGSNSILAYLISTRFMDPFRSVARILFDGLAPYLGDYWHPVWMALASYGLVWLLLVHLRRNRIFLKI